MVNLIFSGRFLKPTSADDCVFGNTFDQPIRDRLPYGTSLAVKAISYIDPSFEVCDPAPVSFLADIIGSHEILPPPHL